MTANNRWVIAVSGGPDSMALLHKMISNKIDCIVCHVNYHMRDVSDEEETLVRNFCREQGVELRVLSFIDSGVGNFQDRARKARYNFFKKIALETKAKGVIVGHHLDDDLETYVFQKQRKMMSTAVGLSEFSNYQGLRIWRPLLAWTKEELINYCEEKSISFAVDESNFETKYTRNAIRHSMDNKEELLVEMNEKRIEHKILNERISLGLDSLRSIIDLEEYRSISDDIRVHVLREWLIREGVYVFDYSKRFFVELDRQISLGNAYHEFDSAQLYCGHGQVLLDNPKSFRYVVNDLNDSIPGVFSFGSGGKKIQGITFKDEDFPLIIRSWQEGDKINLSYGTKLVGRYFIDAKIPRNKRKSWLVIENALGELIYVVGMGCDVYHSSNIPETFVLE